MTESVSSATSARTRSEAISPTLTITTDVPGFANAALLAYADFLKGAKLRELIEQGRDSGNTSPRAT